MLLTSHKGKDMANLVLNLVGESAASCCIESTFFPIINELYIYIFDIYSLLEGHDGYP